MSGIDRDKEGSGRGGSRGRGLRGVARPRGKISSTGTTETQQETNTVPATSASNEPVQQPTSSTTTTVNLNIEVTKSTVQRLPTSVNGTGPNSKVLRGGMKFSFKPQLGRSTQKVEKEEVNPYNDTKGKKEERGPKSRNGDRGRGNGRGRGRGRGGNFQTVQVAAGPFSMGPTGFGGSKKFQPIFTGEGGASNNRSNKENDNYDENRGDLSDQDQDPTDIMDILTEGESLTHHDTLEEKLEKINSQLSHIDLTTLQNIVAPPTSTNISTNSDDEIPIHFLQLPIILPDVVPNSEAKPESSAATTTDQIPAKKLSSKDSTKNLPSKVEGRVGKLRIYKSGRIQLHYTNLILDVTSATQTSFIQDFAIVNDQNKINNLGTIKSRMVATPNLDSLLKIKPEAL